ncbi:uncharacterized protein LOC135136723 [Zophobas morio]|uniref:uncharacterized protein LOC135136723 n=1 Tax=Zophobas morio TaxID=2755281 RepID=UPI003083E4BC
MLACKLDILIHPTSFSEPNLQKEEKKRGKLKFRFPWRINMLARPKPPPNKKYQPPPRRVYKEFGPLDPITEFFSDQIYRPPLRVLHTNKTMFKDVKGPEYVKRMNRLIDRTWDSIYNFYTKKLRDRRVKRLERKKAKIQAKKPKGKDLEKVQNIRSEWLVKIATAKKPPKPPEIPRKKKALEDLAPFIDNLALPKEYHILKPKELGIVSSKALLYEITPIVQKLALLPDRLKIRPEDLIDHWAIKRSALTAKCTPRIEKLAQPSFSAREARKHEEDKFDPWAISPNALKYKASARILELAKPLERE